MSLQHYAIELFININWSYAISNIFTPTFDSSSIEKSARMAPPS